MVTTPQFDLPFRIENGEPVVVEQDSDKDVLDCVTAALLTERGSRFYVPNFGITDPTFAVQPLNLVELQTEIQTSEPRADLSLTQITQLLETDLTVGVGVIGD